MTRDEAAAESERLAREHPERETHRFVPREGPDGLWSVAKVGLPPVSEEQFTAETRADEKPSTPDDVRDAHSRNVGSPWIGPV